MIKNLDSTNKFEIFPEVNVNEDLKDFIIHSLLSELNLSNDATEYFKEADEIMGKIFTSEVIHKWGEMDLQKRVKIINRYAIDIGKAENINIIGVKIDDIVAKTGNPHAVGYNCGDGYLSLNVRQLQNPRDLLEVLQVITHESRHQFQNDVVRNPDRYEINSETLAIWKKNLGGGNYIDSSEDREGYRNQPIEQDAYNASYAVIKKWIQGLSS